MDNIPHRIIAGAALVLLIPIIGAGAWLWLQWEALAVAMPTLAMVLRILFIAVPPAYVLAFVWQRWGRTRYIDAHHITQQTRARVQVAPHAAHYHHEINTAAGEAPLALPAPIDVIKPMAEWMPWIDEQPHTLLGGRTKAGKTWLATALLERRIDIGADIFILDPHSSDWMGLPVAGGSGEAERRRVLSAITNEYGRRMAIREQHKRESGRELPHDYFDPLVVLIDEANALLEELGGEWKTMLKQVASGSRKVSISLILLAQSPLVEDLGMSGAMRENFSRIALDERSCQMLIDAERDRERKQALQAAFRTMDRPAAAQIGAQTWLLDRRGLTPGQASSSARIWAGWDFASGHIVSSIPPTEPLPASNYFGNESNDAVTSPGAGVAPVTTVTMSAAEIAIIATMLGSLPPSDVAKRLDGYTPKKYGENKQKVEVVKNLMEGK